MSFIEDFKKFAFKGNVIDLAVGVVIGGAFGKIVTAAVNDMVMPMISLFMPNGDWRANGIILRHGKDVKDNVILKYGDFLGSVLDFFIVALVLFVVISKIIRAAEARLNPPESEAPAAPATRPCPFCLEVVPVQAKRCKACTSELPEAVPATAAAS